MSTKPEKRVMGHGSVSQRANGLWQSQISRDGTRSTVYGRTQAQVVAKLHALQKQAADGLPAVNQRTTLAAFLKGWLELVASRVEPRTIRHYTYMVELITGELGRVKLARLSPSDVDRMLASLQTSGLSARTVSHVRAVLRTALTDGEKRGAVTRNVASLSDAPKVPYQPPRILSREAAWALLDAISDPGLQRMATVAVTTGLRQGELLGLRWQDVDWEHGELHVSQALQRLGGTYQLGDVKSRTSRRALPLTPPAVEALTEERQSQQNARLAAGRRWREPITGLIFTTATGQPRNGSAVTHAFADALSTAGLAPMHWHHLRHAFAGLMLSSGVDLGTVSSLLGHSSVSLTLSTYAGVAPSLKRQATDQLARLLARP
jgi:integrase